MKIERYIPDQPVVITINFKNRTEIRELLDGLQIWKPTGGWTSLVNEFFEGLNEAIIDEN